MLPVWVAYAPLRAISALLQKHYVYSFLYIQLLKGFSYALLLFYCCTVGFHFTGLRTKKGDAIVVIAAKEAKLRTLDGDKGTVPRGTLLRVESVDDKWFQVKYGKGKVWINRTDVMSLKPVSKVIDFYTAAIKQKPSADDYARRAELWILEKRIRGISYAKKDYKEATRLNPKLLQAWFKWGMIETTYGYGHGDKDQAVICMSKVIELNPKIWQAWYQRGKAWEQKKEYDKAITDYSETIRLNAKVDFAWAKRGDILFKRKEYKKAIEDYNQVVKLNPKSTHGYNLRIKVWRKTKDDFNEIKDLSEIVRLNPKDPRSWYRRAVFWRDVRKNRSREIENLTEVIKLKPKQVDILLERGNAWKAKGEYAKAVKDYNEAIHLHPKYADAFNRRAWVRACCPDAKYRDGKQAIKDALKACELSGWNNVEHFQTLAAASAEIGNFEKAVEVIQMCRKKDKGFAASPISSRMLKKYQAKQPNRDKRLR